MGGILDYVGSMRSNDLLVSWLMGNAVLIGIFLIVAATIAAATKTDWDNKIISGIRRALFFAAPDMKIPDVAGKTIKGGPDEPTT